MQTAPPLALWRQIGALLPAFLNIFMTGCAVGWTTNAIYFMSLGTEVSATPEEISLIVSATEFGSLAMALPTGLLFNKFGRKKIVIATSVIYFLSWLALALNSSFITMFMARVILGTTFALEGATGLTTIGEIASPEIRGKLTAIYQQFFLLGQGFEIFIGLLFSSYVTLVYSTLALSALFLLPLYWFLETPNYLISISQDEKALKTLRYIRYGRTESEINSEFDNMKKYIEKEKEQKSRTNWFKFIRSKEIGGPLSTFLLVYFFTIISGSTVLRSYVTVIVPDIGFISTQYYPLIRYVIGDLAISLILPLYAEQFQRRTLFMFGALGSVLLYVLLTVTNFSYTEDGFELCKWIYTIGFFSISILTTGFAQPMFFSFKSEILPQHVKGLGCTLDCIVESLANLILFQCFNLITPFGLYYNFIIYAVNNLILYFLVKYLVLECRGKYLSDIQNEINDNVQKKAVLLEPIEG